MMGEIFDEHISACPICGKNHTVLLFKDQQNSEFSLCDKCKSKVKSGMYAVIGVIPEECTENSIYRTGEVRWISPILAGEIFQTQNLSTLLLQNFLYGAPDIMQLLKEIADKEEITGRPAEFSLQCMKCGSAPRNCTNYGHPNCAKSIYN